MLGEGDAQAGEATLTLGEKISAGTAAIGLEASRVKAEGSDRFWCMTSTLQ